MLRKLPALVLVTSALALLPSPSGARPTRIDPPPVHQAGLPDPSRALLTPADLGGEWGCLPPAQVPMEVLAPTGPTPSARTLCGLPTWPDEGPFVLGSGVLYFVRGVPPTTLVTAALMWTVAQEVLVLDAISGPRNNSLAGPLIGGGANWFAAAGHYSGRPVEVAFVVFRADPASAGIFAAADPGTELVAPMAAWAETVWERLVQVAAEIPPEE